MPIPVQYPSVRAPITSFRPLRLNLRELCKLQFWSKNLFFKYAHPPAIPLSRSSYNKFQASTAQSKGVMFFKFSQNFLLKKPKKVAVFGGVF